MIEGRSGGSGRGTRRELSAALDSGSSTSGSYVVSCTDARPEPPTHFLPSAVGSASRRASVQVSVFPVSLKNKPLGTRRRRVAGPNRKGSEGAGRDLRRAPEGSVGAHV